MKAKSRGTNCLVEGGARCRTLILPQRLEVSATALEKAKHESAFGQLVAEQEKELRAKLAEANTVLEETRWS